MANLGNFFPDDIKSDFASDKLKAGVVLRFFVTDTTPPKIKRIIIIAIEHSRILAATVFINSEINPAIFSSEELRKLQYKLEYAKCDFLDHDSYVDCSEIKERTADSLMKLLKSSPSVHLGELCTEEFKAIKELIKGARTIPVRIKKKFSLFL